MEKNLFNEQKNFNDFNTQCGEANRPMKGIDLNKIVLVINRPTTFTFETPLSLDDDTFPDYITALCLHPDLIVPSQCRIGGFEWTRCPNSDISGILVRFSAYLANVLLGIVLIYSPMESSTAVWTQLLTVYSLLVSGMLAMGQAGLSRFHAGMTIFLVMSPLSSTLVVYAVLGFCDRKHRLDSILSQRREHLLLRILVIGFAIISIALVIFTNAADADHFAASPCEDDDSYKTAIGVLLNLLFIPYAGVIVLILILSNTPSEAIGSWILTLLPFVLIVISLVYGLFAKRATIAKACEVQANRWKIWVAWDVLAEHYPFMHFCGVFFVPMLYWIMVNEVRTLGTPDNIFSSTFGQILALFVILPPLYQVIFMVPLCIPWFKNLTCVRVVTRGKYVAPVQSRSLDLLEDGIPEMDYKDPNPESYQVHNIPSLPRTGRP
ncbi:hypothetical protein C8J57DRAFT_1280167 [Mycena rebaudengoi]|nr:hypothetical protein C8J57DRAFT_1280167 [Mycena rebaudengoi]